MGLASVSVIAWLISGPGGSASGAGLASFFCVARSLLSLVLLSSKIHYKGPLPLIFLLSSLVAVVGVFVVHLLEQLLLEVSAHVLGMQEVAVTPS